METLDKILSGDDAAASDPAIEKTPAVTEGADTGAEKPQTVTDPDEPQPLDVNGQKMVPHAALHASKEKVKRYTEEVADFRKSNEALTRQVSELLQRVPVPQRAPEQPIPDFFDDPRKATQHEVQQAVSPQFEQITQTLLAIARDNAETRFTPEKVSEAEQAFISAMQSQKLDPADYHKVVGSPNRYAAAVQWHQRQLAQAEIGDDPAAFKAKLEAEILAKHGITPSDPANPAATPQKPGAAPVMPSNLATVRNAGARAGPTWSGPTQLSDIFKS